MDKLFTRINIDIVCTVTTCFILIYLYFYPSWFVESPGLRLILVFGGGVAPLRYLHELKKVAKAN